jgi:hypothetical protein
VSVGEFISLDVDGPNNCVKPNVGGWATFLGGIKGGAPLLALFETGHAATVVCTNYVMANCGAAPPQQPQPPKPKPTLKQQACNALWSYAKQDMVVAGVDRGIAFTISKASWGLNPFADGTATVFGATAAVYLTAGLVEGTTATAIGCKP